MSEEHFKTFVRYCEQFRVEWNICGWEISYAQTGNLNSTASTVVNLQEKTLRIEFNKDWPKNEFLVTDAELRRVARHEMIHVLLAKVTANSYLKWERDWEQAVQNIETALDSSSNTPNREHSRKVSQSDTFRRRDRGDE